MRQQLSNDEGDGRSTRVYHPHLAFRARSPAVAFLSFHIRQTLSHSLTQSVTQSLTQSVVALTQLKSDEGERPQRLSLLLAHSLTHTLTSRKSAASDVGRSVGGIRRRRRKRDKQSADDDDDEDAFATEKDFERSFSPLLELS